MNEPAPPSAQTRKRGRPKKSSTIVNEDLSKTHPCLHGDQLTKEHEEEEKDTKQYILKINVTEIRDGPYFAGILETYSRLLRQLNSRGFLAAKAGKIGLIVTKACDKMRRALKYNALYLRAVIVREYSPKEIYNKQ